MPIFDPLISSERLSSPNGEFFWHATTIENVIKMMQFDAQGLKPVGSGQLGPGFYVTGIRSDYQKGMARRSRKEDTLDVPLFMLYVFVENFYTLKAHFLKSWDTVATNADFVAVCWYEGGQGGVGETEKGGFIPSKATGQRTQFKYGTYQEEPIADARLMKAMRTKVTSGDAFLQLMWNYASAHKWPSPEDLKPLGELAVPAVLMGPRTVLKRSMLELAFRTEASLARATVVGAKLFSPTPDPPSLKFSYNKQSYSLVDAVTEPMTVGEESPLNFHEEKWMDLEAMLKALKA